MLYKDRNENQKDKIRLSINTSVLSDMVYEAAKNDETLSQLLNRIMSDYFKNKK